MQMEGRIAVCTTMVAAIMVKVMVDGIMEDVTHLEVEAIKISTEFGRVSFQSFGFSICELFILENESRFGWSCFVSCIDSLPND